MIRSAITALCLAVTSSAYAQDAVLWTLRREKDPITDKINSTAMLLKEGDIPLVIRCKNSEQFDVLLSSDAPNKIGAKFEGLLRFGTEPAETIQVIATSQNMVAIDLRQRRDLIPKFVTIDPVAIRYRNATNHEITLAWRAALKPNMLHTIARVLADCGIIPFPQEALDTAIKEIENQAGDAKTGRKRRR